MSWGLHCFIDQIILQVGNVELCHGMKREGKQCRGLPGPELVDGASCELIMYGAMHWPSYELQWCGPGPMLVSELLARLPVHQSRVAEH